MRILWLNHRDWAHPRAGGAERTIREIGRSLAADGHTVVLVAGAWRGGRRDESSDGVRIHRRGTWVGPHLAGWSELRSFRPELVVDDLAHAAPWASGWLTQAPVVPYFRHLHARTLRGQVPTAIVPGLTAIERRYRWVYPRATWVAESPSSRSDLVALGVPASTIEEIPPGVDLELFRPRTRSDEPSLIYYGGFRAYKRPEHAVFLVDELRRRDRFVRLHFAGTGRRLPLVRARVQQLGLGDRIDFLGRLPDAILAEQLSTAWVNVHASVSEGWCLTAIEAAASGVPTVGYDVPGLRDSVRSGSTGELVADGSISALADATEKVLDDHARYAAASRRRAEELPWRRTFDRWRALVDRLTERPAPPTGGAPLSS